MEFFTVKQIADKWEVSPRRVQILASQGRIKGAKQIDGRWFLPANAQKPADPRKQKSPPPERQEDEYMFPLPPVCLKAGTEISQLSAEKQQLCRLCMLYGSGEFQEARSLGESLLTSQTPYVRQGALYHLTNICIYLSDFAASEVYASQFKLEIKMAKEHRAELALLLVFYDSEMGDVSRATGTVDFSNADAYPDDLLPFLSAMKLLAEMSKFSLDASKKPDIPGYEIMCRSFETQGYFYPSMLMHYYLSSYYSLVDDPKKERQHLERVVAICVEHGSILALAQFLYYSPIVVAEILQSYEPALIERVKPLLEQFITVRNQFIKYKNRSSVPSSMDEEDIVLSIFCAKKYSVEEMAQHFGLSRSGMNRRLSRLYEKWGVASKEEVSDAYVKSLIDWGQS